MKTILNLFTNGHEETWNSIQFSAVIAKKLDARIKLIGVIEPNDADHPVEDMFSKALTLFQAENLEYELEIENGLVEDIAKTRHELISPRDETDEIQNVVVLSPFGRPVLKKMWAGKSFRYLMSLFGKPIFYIQGARLPIKRVLVCVGGLGISVISEGLVLSLSKPGETEVTLLTVVPPIDMDYPEARVIRENWMKLEETDTVVGRTLKHGLETAKKAGVNAECKVRHGNIMEEIKAEIASGNYDLVVMGSTYSSTGLQQLYAPNVTADIAEAFKVPILTIRKLITDR